MDVPEKTVQNKKALKFFGIEVFIILILIIVIIVVLVYLKVFPFSNVISLKPGAGAPTPTFSAQDKAYFESQRQKILQKAQQLNNYNPNLPTEITIVSDVPDVQLTLNNEVELANILKGWKIFGRLYDSSSGLATGTMNAKPLEKIVIHAVSEPQIANRYVNGSTVYSSSSVKLSPGQMDVYIQIDTTKPEAYPQQLMFQLVTMLTKMSNPVNSESDKASRQKIIDSRYAEIREDSGDYFAM